MGKIQYTNINKWLCIVINKIAFLKYSIRNTYMLGLQMIGCGTLKEKKKEEKKNRCTSIKPTVRQLRYAEI